MRLLVILSLLALAAANAPSEFAKKFTEATVPCAQGDTPACSASMSKFAAYARKFVPHLSKGNCANDPPLSAEEAALFKKATTDLEKVFHANAEGAAVLKTLIADASKPSKAECDKVNAAIDKASAQHGAKLLSGNEIDALLHAEDGEKASFISEEETVTVRTRVFGRRAARSDHEVAHVGPGPMSRKLLAAMVPAGAPPPNVHWWNLVTLYHLYFGPAWVRFGGQPLTNAAKFQASDAANVGHGAHVGKQHIHANGAALCNARACGKNGKFSAFANWADAAHALTPFYGGIYRNVNELFYNGAAAAAKNRAGAKYAKPAAQNPAIECYRTKLAAAPAAGYATAVKPCPAPNAAFACHCRTAVPNQIVTIVKEDPPGNAFFLTHYPIL
jgi:hypothetical protein